jgi:DNA-binding transcriptional regulator PaaX
MSRKPEYSKKILKLLAEKPALALDTLAEHVGTDAPIKAKYALQRSLKGLMEAGLVSEHHSGQRSYARLTKDGRKKAASIKLESDTALVNPVWDGNWRVVLIDFPEDRKTERDGIRYLLKKAGFTMLKNSVWISPYPFEHLFMNIKKDLNLTTEIMIFVTDSIDPETEKTFLRSTK